MHIREITPGDLDALTDFWRRMGNPDIINAETWRRRWSGYPLKFIDAEQLPVGWVMESDDGKIVGHLGNVPLVYEFRGKRLIAAVASDWDVEKDARSSSLAMMSVYFSQKTADLFLDSFGTTDSCRIFMAFGAKRMPLPEYDQPLFWIADYCGFTRSVFRKKGWPAAGLLGCLAGLALKTADALKGRQGPLKQDGGLTLSTLSGFDERFDDFWTKLRNQRDKLLLVRERRFLEWYFGDLLSKDRSWVVTCEQDSRMIGYAVCVRKDSSDIGLTRAWVTDLQVLEGGPDTVIPSIITHSLAECRKRGVHVLEAVGFDDVKRGKMKELMPRTRRFPNWPFVYKAGDKSLAGILEDPTHWDPCPCDGADAF